MAQLHSFVHHIQHLQEHSDYASGSIISAIYNVHRDTKKNGALEWWECMPRWNAKYRALKQLAAEEQLKAYFYELARAQNQGVQ